MYAVVRVRGTVRVIPDIKKTLSLLALNNCNHCVLVDENVNMKGMLNIAKDYVTWGEIDAPTLGSLLRHRARAEGDMPVTPEMLKKVGYDSFDSLAQAILAKKADFAEIERRLRMKHVLRLHPPAKGYKGGIKRSFRAGGSLGYRGAGINGLLGQMLSIDEKQGGAKPAAAAAPAVTAKKPAAKPAKAKKGDD